MRPLKYVNLWLIVGWGMVLLVVAVSLIPSPADLVPFKTSDKLAHFMVYFVLMLWFGFIYHHGKKYLILGLGLISLGILLEVLQGMTTYRTMEYKDIMVNSLGVLAAWLLSRTRMSSFLIFFEQKFLGAG